MRKDDGYLDITNAVLIGISIVVSFASVYGVYLHVGAI